MVARQEEALGESTTVDEPAAPRGRLPGEKKLVKPVQNPQNSVYLVGFLSTHQVPSPAAVAVLTPGNRSGGATGQGNTPPVSVLPAGALPPASDSHIAASRGDAAECVEKIRETGSPRAVSVLSPRNCTGKQEGPE